MAKKVHLNTLLDTNGASVKPLCIKLPQLEGYAKYCDDNKKCMNFLVHNKQVLKACNTI